MKRTGKATSMCMCTVTCGLLILNASPGLAAMAMKNYRFVREIRAPERGRDQLMAVRLDAEMYEATRRNYADLRIVDDTDTEVARLVQQKLETSKETIYPETDAEITELVTRDDNRIELIVEVPEKLDSICGVRLATPLRDFERSISVYGRAAEESDWEPLAENEVMYDYSRFADIRSDRIRFDEGVFKNLKIEIHAVTDVQASRLMKLRETFTGAEPTARTETKTLKRRPFRIDSAFVLTRHVREKVESAVQQAYDPASVEIETDDPAETTVTVTTRRQPVTRISLVTDSTNFSRRILVKCDEKHGERTIAEKELYDLSYRDLQKRDCLVVFDELRTPQLELVITNGDNPPINVSGVTLAGNVYEMVFLAKPGRTYSVYYGYGRAKTPHYDDATLRSLLRREYAPVMAEFEAEQKNPAYAPSATGFLSGRTFFILALVLMVAVLAFALFAAAKRV